MTPPDFSGSWRFDPGRSALEIPPPASVRFAIEHREPRFRLERTLVIGGRSDTFALELTTDGEATSLTHHGAEIEARLFWDGDALVFESKVTRDGEPGTNFVRYTLADQGRTLVAQERFRSRPVSYDNSWVFARPDADSHHASGTH